MGEQVSIFHDSQKVKHIQDAFQHIDFSLTQKQNLSLQKLQKRKQIQLIHFKYNFVNYELQKDKNNKEQQEHIETFSQNIFQTNLNEINTWSNYLNQKILIIENQSFEDPDELKIKTIKKMSTKQKKYFEFTENQVLIKINIQSLQSKEEKEKRTIKYESHVIKEEDCSENKYSIKSSQNNNFVDLYPLKTRAFIYKSYSTRNILKNVVHQLISKKGIKQFIIVGSFNNQDQQKIIKRTFISKILEVFYQLDEKWSKKYRNWNKNKINRKSINKNQEKVFGISVILICKKVKKNEIDQQLNKLRNKMSIKCYDQQFIFNI